MFARVSVVFVLALALCLVAVLPATAADNGKSSRLEARKSAERAESPSLVARTDASPTAGDNADTERQASRDRHGISRRITRGPVLRTDRPGSEPSLEVQGGGGPGKPRGLAILSSWVVADAAAPEDLNLTEPFWFDDEFLSVVALFFPATDRPVRATILIHNENGVLIDGAEDTLVPDIDFFPGDWNSVVWDIGFFDAGFYRLTLKFKQGRKKVAIKYWILVDFGQTAKLG